MRSFQCACCQGWIQIPLDLPPTTAPCPHCGATITSPAPEHGSEADGSQPFASVPGELPAAAPGVQGTGRYPVPTGPAQRVEEGAPGGMAPPPGPQEPGPDPTPPLIDELEDSPSAAARKRVHPAIAFLAAVVLIVGVLMALVITNRKELDPAAPVASVLDRVEDSGAGERQGGRENFLKDGWKSATTKTLAGFLQAQSHAEKARYIIGGESRLQDMADFYAGVAEVDESDTPVDAFSHLDLDIVDKRRGLFLMRFERPPQLKMTEFFRPVAPLEIQHKLEEPGLLLSAFAARERFSMDPVRVMAFFKEEGDRLLLDWDVYTQTKYRKFKHFITAPSPGQEGTFRVMVREAPPANGAEVEDGDRSFRLSDPAFYKDQLTVSVPREGLAGRILSDLAWINIPDRRAENRYATVRLSWSREEESRVQLEEVVCWEFLGLGGVAGNADPIGEPEEGLPLEAKDQPGQAPGTGEELGDSVAPGDERGAFPGEKRAVSTGVGERNEDSGETPGIGETP